MTTKATPGKKNGGREADDLFSRIVKAYDVELDLERLFVRDPNDENDENEKTGLATYLANLAYGHAIPDAFAVLPLFAATHSASSRFFVRISASWAESTNLWMMIVGKPGKPTAPTPSPLTTS
jgi:hypothetical protein